MSKELETLEQRKTDIQLVIDHHNVHNNHSMVAHWRAEQTMIMQRIAELKTLQNAQGKIYTEQEVLELLRFVYENSDTDPVRGFIPHTDTEPHFDADQMLAHWELNFKDR